MKNIIYSLHIYLLGRYSYHTPNHGNHTLKLAPRGDNIHQSPKAQITISHPPFFHRRKHRNRHA